MRYIIYIDKVWLMDFVISTYLLFLTGQTYRMQKRLIRLLASAAAGATVFTILLLLPGIGFLPKILIQTVCVNPLLLRAAFSFRTKEMVVKAYACMHGYGLLIGGITACVSGYLPGGQRRLHFWEILFLCTLSAGAVSLYLFLRKKSRKEAGLYAVKMDFYGKKLDVTGFADSGNGLYEPYARYPFWKRRRRKAFWRECRRRSIFWSLFTVSEKNTDFWRRWSCRGWKWTTGKRKKFFQE